MQSQLFKTPIVTDEEVKCFLNENASKSEVKLTPEMESAIKRLTIKYINTLIDKPVLSLPEHWSPSQLIKNARHIRAYQGFQVLANNNKLSFTHDYLHFMNTYKKDIKKNIRDNNLFIAYIHVVSLFKKIAELNQICDAKPCAELRSSQLKTAYQELHETVGELTVAQDKDSKFWSVALISIGFYALASVHYIVHNDNFYNLDYSKSLLKLVLKLCEEGEAAQADTKEIVINFYTLGKSFLPTLPYSSFEQIKKDIHGLNIWFPGELANSSRRLA